MGAQGAVCTPSCQEGREAGPASFHSPGEGRARLPWKPDHGRPLASIRLIRGSLELIGKEPGCVFSFLPNSKAGLLAALDCIRGEFDIVSLDRVSGQGANLSHLFGFVKEPGGGPPGRFAIDFCPER